MELIKNWATSITGAIMLGAICNMIMPKGNIKKYINMVLGIILILSVVKPLTKISSEKFCEELLISEREQAYEQSNNFEEYQKKYIMKTYCQNLSEKMKEGIKKSGDNADVIVEAYENKENFGEIKKVEVILENGSEGDIKSLLNNAFGIQKDVIVVTNGG